MFRSPSMNVALVIVVLSLVVISTIVALLGGNLVLVAVVAIALAGGVGAFVVLKQRQRVQADNAYRPDLDRLRPGRLRDGCIHVAGYRQQLAALAETLPQAPLRAALKRDLPRADAALRAVYALCLTLQAYELGEDRPSAQPRVASDGDDAFIIEAEAELQATLDTLSQVYGDLRRTWSDPERAFDPQIQPLAALDSHIARLHDLAGAPGASSLPRSVARQEM